MNIRLTILARSDGTAPRASLFQFFSGLSSHIRTWHATNHVVFTKVQYRYTVLIGESAIAMGQQIKLLMRESGVHGGQALLKNWIQNYSVLMDIGCQVCLQSAILC